MFPSRPIGFYVLIASFYPGAQLINEPLSKTTTLLPWLLTRLLMMELSSRLTPSLLPPVSAVHRPKTCRISRESTCQSKACSMPGNSERDVLRKVYDKGYRMGRFCECLPRFFPYRLLSGLHWAWREGFMICFIICQEIFYSHRISAYKKASCMRID